MVNCIVFIIKYWMNIAVKSTNRVFLFMRYTYLSINSDENMV